MNKRIKELVKQAEQYAIDNANKGEDEDYEYSFDDDFQEKFAELIIRECAEIADMNAVEAMGIYGKVLEHFGVEE
jgi:hypothetical protein